MRYSMRRSAKAWYRLPYASPCTTPFPSQEVWAAAQPPSSPVFPSRLPSPVAGHAHRFRLRYATELEGHADNVAAALLGGLVVTATRADGAVLALRAKRGPKKFGIIAVTPDLTSKRSNRELCFLPPSAAKIAVQNLQRSALLIAALEEKRFDLLWDAVQDRLHQTCRARLIPGLAGILQMPRAPGLLGIVLKRLGPHRNCSRNRALRPRSENPSRITFERHRLRRHDSLPRCRPRRPYHHESKSAPHK